MPSAAPRSTTFVSPAAIDTSASRAADAIDAAIRRRSAVGKPSSTMKPAVSASGCAPTMARSLTVPFPASSPMSPPGKNSGLTTDSFVVKPLFFPGGDIGELAGKGTVNDLAMVGAHPLALTAGFIVEEGFPTADLRRIAASMASAAREAEVSIAAGDTKVVERGAADGIYVNTAGVGIVAADVELSPTRVRPGDRVLVSGTIGDHGMAIMIARGNLELEVDLESDTAPLASLVGELLHATD